MLPENLTYLDGNSLGPLPVEAASRVGQMMTDEWGKLLIRGWNDAYWMQQPSLTGDRIARLIGASPGTVVMGDTLSIKVYQALACALSLKPDRSVVLSDTGNFPTDLYMARGLMKSLGTQYELKLVAPEEVAGSIDESVAAVLLTEVDYRTGRLHDMKELTRLAHASGALTIWDLAHSAGAIEVNLEKCNADFAVGCTYKYLNSGPGGPAFIYAAPEHTESSSPQLAGWLGHEAPFDFDIDYRPGKGIERMRVGTPPVLQLASLNAALDIWEDVSIADVRKRSIELSELFIREVEKSCPQLTLVSPRDPDKRGSQVSFSFEPGYAVMQALIHQGVIGDFRAPDIIRFGITPLYLNEEDIQRAADTLAGIMKNRSWDKPEFHARSAVT